MDRHTTKRGNYELGSDYVLEYGELRFTFNERDFTERVEQAAMKLALLELALDEAELHRGLLNERDFTERVEQAAMKLGFVEGQLEEGEREDLVNLAVNS